ncbi:MAG: aldolase/citrate lyase family protein, partial [Acidobacteriota bacterium]
MKTSLSAESIAKITGRLRPTMSRVARLYPGESGSRQPVHTVYGGAHLFKLDTATRLGQLAVRSFEKFAPDASTFATVLDLPAKLADTVFTRVGEKLAHEAVEDLRIDFEDGYGYRSDEEEDGNAVSTATDVAKGMTAGELPPFFGIRIKSFSDETIRRSVTTLDLFLTTLVSQSRGILPENFVVTLPKIVAPEQVAALADIFDEIEPRLGLDAGALKMEIMIETTQSIIGPDGIAAMPRLLHAARGRCVAAHFGAYDYTASCGIAGPYQDMLHPACDFARNMMLATFAGT